MMQKLWQIKPKLEYSREVFDIVQFGSSVICEKEFRDVDVAVIFKGLSVGKQVDEAYKLKKQLEKLVGKKVHISNYDFYSLFDVGNFAREGIVFYGRSIISGKYFTEGLGFKPRIQIFYSLRKLDKKDKIRFHYMLKGKGKKYGLLRKHGGKLVSPGLIEISPEHEKIFTDAIKEIISEFGIKRVLVG